MCHLLQGLSTVAGTDHRAHEATVFTIWPFTGEICGPLLCRPLSSPVGFSKATLNPLLPLSPLVSLWSKLLTLFSNHCSGPERPPSSTSVLLEYILYINVRDCQKLSTRACPFPASLTLALTMKMKFELLVPVCNL